MIHRRAVARRHKFGMCIIYTVPEIFPSSLCGLPEGSEGPPILRVTSGRYGHLPKSDDHNKALDAIATDMLG